MIQYDEHELDDFIAAGRKAWADVPDASQWVRDHRGEVPESTSVLGDFGTDGAEKIAARERYRRFMHAAEMETVRFHEGCLEILARKRNPET